MTTTPRHRPEVGASDRTPRNRAATPRIDSSRAASGTSAPRLQVALDLLILDRALGIAAEAAAGGAEIIVECRGRGSGGDATNAG